MENKSEHDRDVGTENQWWWWSASAAQAMTALVAYRLGRRSESVLMPVKAFFVASLILGSGATTIAGCLSASGIHQIEDLKEVGKNIRTGAGIPPRETTN